MNSFLKDLRYGARMLVKKPGFTLISVITLALGIGATSTIFSFINGLLLRPLPYTDSERLALLDETAFKRGVDSMGVSFPNFVDWRERNQVFSGVAAYLTRSFTLTGTGEPERLSGANISYDTFEILGIPPALGRTFTADEDRPEHDLVAILSHDLWERSFGRDPDIIGKPITLNNRTRTVIGVMPKGFKFPEVSDLWTPLGLDTRMWTRNDHGLESIARLKPGVTVEQAQEDMSAVAQGIEEQNPVTNEGMGVNVIPLRNGLVGGDYRKALMILLGVVGLLLLIACANVANLLLARATSRHKEMAIRSALGAGRGQVFRQLLTESLLLGVIGGALGMVVALWGLDLLLAAIPIDFPFWMKFDLDGRVLGFTAGISLVTGLVFGTVPALQASRVDLSEALKEGGRSSGGTGRHHMRRLLVIAEVALSLILLIGAGLMMRSFLRLIQVDPGLNPEKVLTMQVNLPGVKYDSPEKRQSFFKQLIERVGALREVEAASATSSLPLSGDTWGRSLTVEGYPVLSVGQAPAIYHNVITPNYFRAMGISLLTGRDFTEADSSTGAKVTIIDERLARQYWPTESPLGKRIRFGPPEANEPWHTIVGVVAEVKQVSLNLSPRRSVYLPYAQIPVGGMTLAVRAGGSPESLAEAIRSHVKEIDAGLPVTLVRTMREVISRSVWQPRLYAILFGVFAAIALVLASVGIYGVMSYAVTERTHEIGIRLALGARKSNVLGLVVGQGMTLTFVGTAIGLAGAFGLTRLMKSLLFGVSATDPLTFAVIALLLASVAFAACYFPARRAMKVDPMIALRYE
jgi:putative ABC transport system permease protein